MVSWSPPVAPFDYYRVSYRPTQGNEIVRFREEEWDLELGEGRCGESSTSQRLSPPPPVACSIRMGVGRGGAASEPCPRQALPQAEVTGHGRPGSAVRTEEPWKDLLRARVTGTFPREQFQGWGPGARL